MAENILLAFIVARLLIEFLLLLFVFMALLIVHSFHVSTSQQCVQAAGSDS